MRRALAALALAGLAFGGLTGTDAAPTPTAVVDDDGFASASNCNANTAAHSTVATAVAAADDNWVVKICPGSYSLGGGVTIPADKPGIVVRGPRLTDGKSRRLPNATEAVINTGRFDVQATGVRIEGLAFTTTGGISAPTTDGFQVRNNLFWYFFGDPLTAGTLGAGSNVIERNRFVGRPDAGSNYAINYSNAGRLTVSRNTFDNLDSAAVVFTGITNNVTIEHNIATNVANVVWTSSGNDIAIRSNTIGRRPDPSAPAPMPFPSIRVAMGGAFSGVVIERNRVSRSPQDAIIIEGDGSNIAIRHNVVEFPVRDGILIDVQPAAGVSASSNTVRNAGRDGFSVRAGSVGDTFDRNQVVRSTGFDCLDGSDPTDNTWTSNRGANAAPDTICR